MTRIGDKAVTVPPDRFPPLSDAEWRIRLEDLAIRVTRQGGTERPFTHDDFPPGPAVFHCICCDAPLFDASPNYDAGCFGWPAFSAPTAADRLRNVEDRSWCMCRTEVRCATCDAHLGHVFNDGPPPSGVRDGISGVALRHVPK